MTKGDWEKYRAHRLNDLAVQLRRKEKKIVVSPELGIPLEHFKANIKKLAELSSLPAYFLLRFFIAGNFMCRSTLYATGKRNWKVEDMHWGQTRLARKKYNELWNLWNEASRATQKKTQRSAGVRDDTSVGRMIGQVALGYDSGFNALMSSIIVGAWTSFEVLAEELWVAALNAQPLIAIAVLDEQLRDVDVDSEEFREARAAVRIPIWSALNDPKWKFAERMGDLLKNWRFRFSEKDEVVKAYRSAFPKYQNQIRGIFNDKQLTWVSLTRNAIVHNAARVPEYSVKKLREYAKMAGVSNQSQIPIDGDVVYDLTVIAINSGISLLDFVDKRIKNFPN